MIVRGANFFGIDVGGTTTRVGLVAPDGRVIASDRFDTPKTADALVDRLAARIASLRLSTAVAGIGLALPGPVDAGRGVLVRSVNLPFLQGFPIVEELSRRTSLGVTLMTDAEAATWGEFEVCRPSPARFVHLRFGTGIACAIVVDGKLARTSTNRGTHLPDLVVDHRAEAPPCACGLRGCLELFASGPAIALRAGQIGLPADLAALQVSHSAGNTGVRDFVDEVAGWIVRGIRGVVDPLPCPALRSGGEAPDTAPALVALSVASVGRGSDFKQNPTIVCLGGGVLQSLPSLFKRAHEHWSASDATIGGRIEIQLSRLGDVAGVIGAALLAANA